MSGENPYFQKDKSEWKLKGPWTYCKIVSVTTRGLAPLWYIPEKK